jgi:hypothetical protein
VKELDGTELGHRLASVRERIRAAALRVGRDPETVALVGVSKSVDSAAVRAAMELGLRDFGENRIQEWLGKALEVGPDARWHLIGHLQTNKVRYLGRGITVLQSIDRPELLPALDARWPQWSEAARVAGRTAPYGLLQVNVAGEESKGGFRPADIERLVDILRGRAAEVSLPVRGLMTIAPYVIDAEQVRWVFRSLRQLRDTIEASTGMPLPELSMGMSGDFEVAVEEGATLVRIGTAIFGPRR